MTEEEIREKARDRIYELIPSEADADTQGHFESVVQDEAGNWKAVYKIPLIIFTPDGVRNQFDLHQLSLTAKGEVTDVQSSTVEV